MFKSSVLKKVVSSILALAAVSTFSVGSCFAFDGGYDDSDNQTEPSTSYESSDEFSCDAYNESSDEDNCNAYYKPYEDPDYDLYDDPYYDLYNERFGEDGFEEYDEKSNEAVYDEFKVVIRMFDCEGPDEFNIEINSRGEKYDEDHAKQMMSPEEPQNADTDSSADLDPNALIEGEKEYDEDHAKQMMSPEESENSNTDSSSDLDPDALM